MLRYEVFEFLALHAAVEADEGEFAAFVGKQYEAGDGRVVAAGVHAHDFAFILGFHQHFVGSRINELVYILGDFGVDCRVPAVDDVKPGKAFDDGGQVHFAVAGVDVGEPPYQPEHGRGDVNCADAFFVGVLAVDAFAVLSKGGECA